MAFVTRKHLPRRTFLRGVGATIALPLLACVPIAVLTSRAAAGRWARDRGLLLTPEEQAPPPVLRAAWGLSRPRGT